MKHKGCCNSDGARGILSQVRKSIRVTVLHTNGNSVHGVHLSGRAVAWFMATPGMNQEISTIGRSPPPDERRKQSPKPVSPGQLWGGLQNFQDLPLHFSSLS